MKWFFAGDKPVYLQIMEQIRSRILSGEYVPGQKIPSVRDLAMEARVNPNTMQHALQELEQTGILITQGTSGRRVTDDPQILKDLRQRQLRQTVADCAAGFAALGISASQAAALLAEYGKEKEEA